jgi:lipoate-protein ligase A
MWIDDQILRRHDKRIHSEIFIPEETMVVLGSGNDPQTEVNLEACSLRNIQVLRRYGGGGTVVLYPGCVVVSAGCWVKDPFKNNFYFKLLNDAVKDALAAKWTSMSGLSQAGISDIVMGEKKVAGTSMFRSRNYLLYQASILVGLDRTLVNSVLRHPTKEPDYRKGRSHADFLTSLMEIEQTIKSAALVKDALENHLEENLLKHLADQLIDPVMSQMPALQARLARAEEESQTTVSKSL